MFEIRKAKILALATTLVLLIVSSVAGFAAANIGTDNQSNSDCVVCSKQAISPTEKELQETTLPETILLQLENQVKTFIDEDTRLRHWKLLDLKITLISQKRAASKVEVIFDVERKHLLNYPRPEDAPALKGRLDFLEGNGKELSPAALGEAQKEIEIWKHDLQDYITNPQDCFDRLKVTGELNGNGSLIPATVGVYGEGPMGDYALLDLNSVPNEKQVEKAAFKSIQRTVSEAKTPLQARNVSALSSSYDRLAARDYANRWTSNTTKPCREGSSTTQDPAYYNTSEYSTWYQCNDCANYVSQALRAGGIPTDATWKPYTNTWIRVNELEQYMKNTKGYWAPTNIDGCVAGYPFRIVSYDHVMMMVYNDGSTRKFSAHTSDRLKVNWSGGSDVRYYRVVY